MKLYSFLSPLSLTAALATATSPRGVSHPTHTHSRSIINQTTCGDSTYTYTGLEGYGHVASNARDKYGDTLAGLGSSAALERGSWRKTGDVSYTGTFWLLPDRGWNTNGTLNFTPRIHKFNISLTLAANVSATNPSSPNMHLAYLDTILLSDPTGKPLTGLDPDVTGNISYKGFPALPAATYAGNGFGGPGKGDKRVSLDAEGLAIDNEGYYWVSDEYGPYIYRFDREGKMVFALQPPQAYLPRRNGSVSFNAASPPLHDPDLKTTPEDPDSGRNNNQGFEALTISPDGRTMSVMIQSSLNQEGGPKKKNRQAARVLVYDISIPDRPVYRHEYAVTLPKYIDYTDDDLDGKVASQSEILQIPGQQGAYFILSRDGFGGGAGIDETFSVYRQVDIFSISNSTTDLKGEEYDAPTGSIASPKGELNDDIEPAEYCSFLDYNVPSELAKFGLHNGGQLDGGLLNEKWESLVLVPVEPEETTGTEQGHGVSRKSKSEKKEYFLFSFNDNDFITQDGAMNFGRLPYADESGLDLNTQALVFRVVF